VAFDKTGTLTVGRPAVSAVTALNGFVKTDLLSVAASLESRSEHPIADAIVREAKENSVYQSRVVDQFEAVPGRGVRGTVDGAVWLLGNRRFLEETGIPLDGLSPQLEADEQQGQTVVLAASDGRCRGFIAVADRLKPEARTSVDGLCGRGLKVVLLTGDNETTALATAREAGISDFLASLLPEEKIQAVKSLQGQFGPVMMVGDGINDSPAMAESDVGVAMGAAGTDIAMETGDVVLMADDLSRLPELMHLSRRTVRNIKQNIFASLLIVTILVPSALMGWMDLLPGLLLNEGAALLVILNGSRLVK
jgi:Cd2+/Zn2+-exporting ATPase